MSVAAGGLSRLPEWGEEGAARPFGLGGLRGLTITPFRVGEEGALPEAVPRVRLGPEYVVISSEKGFEVLQPRRDSALQGALLVNHFYDQLPKLTELRSLGLATADLFAVPEPAVLQSLEFLADLLLTNPECGTVLVELTDAGLEIFVCW